MHLKSDTNKVVFVAGGAGFIGSHLVARLIEQGSHVIVADNFSRGQAKYLSHIQQDKFTLLDLDCSDENSVLSAFSTITEYKAISEVWHLAANSDIPAGVADLAVDLKDTFMTTVALLKAMEANNCVQLYFASSSAIYGDLGEKSLHEKIGPLLPISNYGAMKLASEAAISAACEKFLQKAILFRFPNVIGVPATHGIILDLTRKLLGSSTALDVLGDGTQKKAYLHVSELVSAMLFLRNHHIIEGAFPINIGPSDDGIFIHEIAKLVVKRVAPHAEIRYGSGNKGWVGDVPRFKYSTKLLQSFGWVPQLTSHQAVDLAVQEIAKQEAVQ